MGKAFEEELLMTDNLNFPEHHKNCKHLVRDCISIKELANEFSLGISTVRRHYDNGTYHCLKSQTLYEVIDVG